LSQQLKKEIQENKNETFNDFLKELSDDKDTDYSLWRATKSLKYKHHLLKRKMALGLE
jgi:hypothetical protein